MNLQENENILLELKPNKSSIIYFFIIKLWHSSFLIIAIAVMFFSKLNKTTINHDMLTNTVLVIFVLLIIYFIVAWFFIRRIINGYSYIITNQRCILKYGFLYLNRRDIPYRNINDVNLRSNIIEKAFGLGSVYINDISTAMRVNTRVSNNTCRMEGLTLDECEKAMDLINENIQKSILDRS
ncbi:PH domain-containing protein [Francisella sp. LA112445]|uniref:PH domain-containing protein n=1 Tax=Francisella sp. LA112445 TaxID=1395624 RepID=UPI001788E598|nr:PH domain-containing protein [Francisella sp. LA112445]QIW09811.1 hypothetical protein FIP56_03600 [Francisella sp. LA112445]